MPGSKRLTAATALARTFLTFERPDRLPRAVAAMRPWGTSTTALVAGAAARYPDRVAVHDDLGTTTYRQLWQRSEALATGLVSAGVGPGTRVGLLARNHGGFVEALTAVGATGADLVLLNTGFAAPQLADVVEHEGIEVVIHDDEFAATVDGCGAELFDESARTILAAAPTAAIAPTKQAGTVVILTSGTTGRPKGAARRSDSASVEGLAAVLDRIPLRLGDTQVIAAPLFHAWGLSHLLLGLSRCTTNVLARRFVADDVLTSLDTHEAEVLVVVPVMLARLCEAHDSNPVSLPNLRVIASSGSVIGGPLVVDVMERFGPVLYNLYGSTEVAVATIATPGDLATAPTTAGRVALGVDVEILDEHGGSVVDGTVGRVFVGGAMRFDGYTNGGDKERIRGLLSSGDMGYFRDGLLFVEGRDDDMIVSGGENVFPGEVEECLREHADIADAAVIGIADTEFGQALAAFVVVRKGAPVGVEQVRSHVRDHLARHKVPRTVTFLDELPRNETGKVVRRALA